MTMAGTLHDYLTARDVPFTRVAHPHTTSSLLTAEVTHIDPGHIAKGVLLEDGAGFLLAVLSAARELDLKAVENALDRRLTLADEARLMTCFPDCQLGAVPALGPAYGLSTLVDEGLRGRDEIYLEAGDHELLIRMEGAAFDTLLKGADHASISLPRAL